MNAENEIKIKWNLNNTYTNLPKMFYSRINLNPVTKPELVIFNDHLAKDLGLSSSYLKDDEGIAILSGSKEIEEGAYIAQAYAGHQFGHFTMLGDGRAVLIGEIITPKNERYDIQLKGSGKTPYSRGGDGRAVLGPMIREYIISEAMHSLKIPTTRSLAVVKTGENVIREDIKEGAILTRIAKSHIRFGTFEYAASFGEKEDVKYLADYCIKRHYPNINDDSEKYINFLNEVMKTHASLVSKWQAVGFIHGVMNTDNMTISGEAIDYGPCAFMDVYNPSTVFSSIDVNGRYAYKNQPVIANWNLSRFAETLLPLIHENLNEAVKIAQNIINNFPKEYELSWLKNMREKLGLFNKEENDKSIIENLLNIIQKYNEDYTNTFKSLTTNKLDKDMFNSIEFKNWYIIWQERLDRQSENKDLVYNLMKQSNPAVIPRNHRVEEVIDAADKGDYAPFEKLIKVISNPFEYSKEQEEYSVLPKCLTPYKTYCGT